MSDTDNTKIEEKQQDEQPEVQNSPNDEILKLLKGMKENMDSLSERVDGMDKKEAPKIEEKIETKNPEFDELQKKITAQQEELQKMQEKMDKETTNTMDFNDFVPTANAVKTDDYETQINKDLQFITKLEVKHGG